MTVVGFGITDELHGAEKLLTNPELYRPLKPHESLAKYPTSAETTTKKSTTS